MGLYLSSFKILINNKYSKKEKGIANAIPFFSGE
jgi:hypothetical protein